MWIYREHCAMAGKRCHDEWLIEQAKAGQTEDIFQLAKTMAWAWMSLPDTAECAFARKCAVAVIRGTL